MKLIFSDLDGTLLTTNKQILSENILTAMKNVGKCMIMLYFHKFWPIRAFHFSCQRLR